MYMTVWQSSDVIVPMRYNTDLYRKGRRKGRGGGGCFRGKGTFLVQFARRPSPLENCNQSLQIFTNIVSIAAGKAYHRTKGSIAHRSQESPHFHICSGRPIFFPQFIYLFRLRKKHRLATTEILLKCYATKIRRCGKNCLTIEEEFALHKGGIRSVAEKAGLVRFGEAEKGRADIVA